MRWTATPGRRWVLPRVLALGLLASAICDRRASSADGPPAPGVADGQRPPNGNPSGPQALSLVEAGQPTSVIVLPVEWVFWQRLAAQELQYHLKRMTGATIPIVTEDKVRHEPRVTPIHVGQTERVLGLGIDTRRLPPETLVVKVADGMLILAGEDGTQFPQLRRPRSTDVPLHSLLLGVRHGSLLAVYEFLETQLGCHWIFPGDPGAVIPRRPTVRVSADIDIQRTPKLAQRHFRSFLSQREKQVLEYRTALRRFPKLLDLYKPVSDDDALWLLRMRMGSAAYFSYGHAFTRWWDDYGKEKPVMPEPTALKVPLGDADETSDGDAEDGKDAGTATRGQTEVKTIPGKPELFALLPDGSRGCQKGGNPEYVKMCVSNPDLWDLLLRQFRDRLAEETDIPLKVLNLCENDGDDGFCTCERCRAWDISVDGKPVMQGSRVVLSDRYARFFNEMAKRVRAVHPEAWVIGYAYSWYQPAPKAVTVEPNVVIACTEFSRYPARPEARAHARRTYLGWSRGGARMILRPNAFCFFGTRLPFIATRDMAEDFRFTLEHGLWGTDFDGFYGYWATSGPTYYVIARMHWDTEASADQLLEEYYGAYGPLAGVARRYFEFWEEDTVRGPRDVPSAIAAAHAILDAARPLEEKASTEEIERFRNIELGLKHCELMQEARRPGEGAEDREKRLAAARRLIEFRHEIALRHVTNVLWLTLIDVRNRQNDLAEMAYPDSDKSRAEPGGGTPTEPQVLDILKDSIEGGILKE